MSSVRAAKAARTLLSFPQPHFPSWRNGRAAPIFYEKERMTQVYERERRLQREVADAVESALPEVEVVAVELGGSELMWVFVDHPNGVDHALCERVTGALSGFLARYTVNVSSPGFERPLRTPAHFGGAVGRRVSVRTREPVAGRTRFRAEVAAAGDQEFTLVTGSGERVLVPYDAIARCNLIDEGR